MKVSNSCWRWFSWFRAVTTATIKCTLFHISSIVPKSYMQTSESTHRQGITPTRTQHSNTQNHARVSLQVQQYTSNIQLLRYQTMCQGAGQPRLTQIYTIKRFILSVIFCRDLSNDSSLRLLQQIESKLSAVLLCWCSSLRDQDLFLREIRLKQWQCL